MPVLRFKSKENETDFELPLSIGSKFDIGRGDANDLVFPDHEMAIHHASITRANNGLYIILARDHAKIIINGYPIPDIKVLRNEDEIVLGETSMAYQELQILNVTPGSDIIGRQCMFDLKTFQEEDRVVLCPKCDTVYHEVCWNLMFNQTCLLPNCGYLIEKKNK